MSELAPCPYCGAHDWQQLEDSTYKDCLVSLYIDLTRNFIKRPSDYKIITDRIRTALQKGEKMKMTIKMEGGLARYNISLIQAVEKDVDRAMVLNGFTRTETTKSHEVVEFKYQQFGKCL